MITEIMKETINVPQWIIIMGTIIQQEKEQSNSTKNKKFLSNLHIKIQQIKQKKNNSN